MVVSSLTKAVALITDRLAKYQKKAQEINDACEALGLPPALDIDLEDDIRVCLDPAYRMEGFGVVLPGLRPNLSFYVHYRKGRPEHVAVGKFLVPIKFSDILKLGLQR